MSIQGIQTAVEVWKSYLGSVSSDIRGDLQNRWSHVKTGSLYLLNRIRDAIFGKTLEERNVTPGSVVLARHISTQTSFNLPQLENRVANAEEEAGFWKTQAMTCAEELQETHSAISAFIGDYALVKVNLEDALKDARSELFQARQETLQAATETLDMMNAHHRLQDEVSDLCQRLEKTEQRLATSEMLTDQLMASANNDIDQLVDLVTRLKAAKRQAR